MHGDGEINALFSGIKGAQTPLGASIGSVPLGSLLMSYKWLSNKVTLKDYYRFTFSPEQLSTGTPSLLTYRPFPPWHSLAVLSAGSFMCPLNTTFCFIFYLYYHSSRTIQTHLTTFSITLFQLTSSALGIPEYPSDVPLGG